MVFKWTLLLLGLSAVAQASVLSYFQIPRHDGVKRVCKLTAENFTSIVSVADTAVIIAKDPVTTVKSACPTELETFAEITAQVLRKKYSIVCETTPDVLSATQANTPVQSGEVYIFKAGNGNPYYGKRSTRALLNHLFKVNGTQVNVITGRIDKIAFDAVEETKIIGFFMLGTADYAAFESAAAHFSPSIRFYAAFDRTVAKHLKLSIVGEIHLIKPFSKVPILCPQNPASAIDIETFVQTNQGSLLTKLNEQNIYDPSIFDSNKILVLAVGEQASSHGGYFYHLVTKLVRNNTNNTEFEKLNIVWIEPNIFPAIHLVMNELETALGFPNKLPAFGALNITTLKSSWLNTATLNCSGDKNADAQNILVLQEFLNGVVTNTLIPVKIGGQSFVQTPTSQTAVEGTDVVLECIVENIVGDCLWLKDTQNIGYNLDRYSHYSWRGDRLTGDCSLQITAIEIGRDDGEWVCEVTGDQDNLVLTSAPAKLLISGKVLDQKTEL